jgi:hypothetical protein
VSTFRSTFQEGEVALVEALTPSTAGWAGLLRSALYRGAHAGRLNRIARGTLTLTGPSGLKRR